MTFRKRTEEELDIIYIGYPEDMMGCDDEIGAGGQTWTPCNLPDGHPDRRKCNFLGTDKCPHNQGKEE